MLMFSKDFGPLDMYRTTEKIKNLILAFSVI